jgi:hypothetical protein
MKKYGRGNGQKLSQLFRVHSSGASKGVLITKFKLCLAGKLGKTDVEQLPQGLTASRVVTDYLRALGELVMGTCECSVGSILGWMECNGV